MRSNQNTALNMDPEALARKDVLMLAGGMPTISLAGRRTRTRRLSKGTIICAGHLRPMLEPKRARYTVKQVVKMIREKQLVFDAIACRGVSCLLIAPIVAMRLNKTLIIVRKDGEKTHSGYTIEGDHAAK